jgi:hypothetical protein
MPCHERIIMSQLQGNTPHVTKTMNCIFDNLFSECCSQRIKIPRLKEYVVVLMHRSWLEMTILTNTGHDGLREKTDTWQSHQDLLENRMLIQLVIGVMQQIQRQGGSNLSLDSAMPHCNERYRIKNKRKRIEKRLVRDNDIYNWSPHTVYPEDTRNFASGVAANLKSRQSGPPHGFQRISPDGSFLGNTTQEVSLSNNSTASA